MRWLESRAGKFHGPVSFYSLEVSEMVALKNETSKSLFSMGRIVCTPGAMNLLLEHGAAVQGLLYRHCHGDWGQVSAGDAGLNDAAVREGTRILSSYQLVRGDRHTRVWIITEADRSSTCLLLPEVY
jgi:hypothetical protein